MKKQFKKGVSLFLAVLMLLSCWVWVAPEKAAAADEKPYTLEITYYVDDPANAGTANLIVTHKDKNGTGTETTTTNDVEKMRTGDAGATYTDSFSYAGFPTQIQVYIKQGGAKTQNIQIKKIVLNGITILEGTFTIKPGWWSSDSKTWKIGQSGGDFGDDTAHNNWTYPTISKLTFDDTIEINAGRLDSNHADDTYATGSASVTALDQYGVLYSPSFSLSSAKMYTDADCTNALSNADASVSGKTATAKIKPFVQTYNPNKQNATYYLKATTGSVSATTKVTVLFQTYTTTFDANGGKIGYTDGSASNQDKITIADKLYGATIGVSPDIQTRTGYDFIGFYSTQHPDSYSLSTPSYPESEKFVDKTTTVGENGDTTYYAAWEAAGVTVTFKTADGQTIATLPARYNSALTGENIYKDLDTLNAAVKAANTNSKVNFDASNEPIYNPGGNEYQFTGWKVIEAYDLSGKSVLDSMANPNETTVLQGNAVLQATYELASKKNYKIDFYGTDGKVLLTKDNYNFNDSITTPTTDPTLTDSSDGQYKYEFIGWADRLGDKGEKYYTLDSADMTEDGAVISYYSKDIASWLVKGDAEYVPVFRRIVKQYSVNFVYNTTTSTTATVTVTYNYGDQISVPAEIPTNYTENGYRYTIEKWEDANGNKPENSTCNGAMTFTAKYDDGVAAVYNINFYNRTGELISHQEVKHNDTVEIPSHDDEKFPQVESDDTYQYTFSSWSEVPQTTATKDVDYRAQYSEKKFATVNFYNEGELIYSVSGKDSNLFVDDKVPEFNDKDYPRPTKEADLTGEYVFKGWVTSDGKTVELGKDTIADSTLDLYANYETKFIDYTVKFVNDGQEVSTETYHYGDKITVPEDPKKAEDNTYTYTFKSWSPDLTNHCYGDVTYEATYRKTYKYYTVTWLHDDKTVQTSNNYIYNAKITAPSSSDAKLPYDVKDGYELVVKEWVKCDKDGNAITDTDGNNIVFTRGDRITENVYYYAVLESVGTPRTVTFYNGSVKLGEAKVNYGTSINDINFEQPTKEATDDEHYTFDKWVDKDNKAVSTIVEDIDVYASYKAEDHKYQLTEILTEATCTSKGTGIYSCSCGKEYEDTVAIIIDGNAPDIKTYVGSNTWTLNEYNSSLNYENVVYVGPKSDFIINTTDIGTRTPENPDAIKTRRVGKIAYYISDKVIEDTSTISTWTETFDYDEAYQSVLESIAISNGLSMDQFNALEDSNKTKKTILAEAAAIMDSYEANSSIKLENLGLENDKEYIIYIKASDREVNGSANTSIMSTGKFHYGTVAPVITVTGKGNSMDFCKEATITVTDDQRDVVVTLDGEKITLSEDGTYKVSTVGNYTVSAKDANGNITTVNFAIGEHKTKHIKIAASCENAGKEYDICTRCSEITNQKDIAAVGHKYNKNNSYDKSPTCVDDGYRVYTCANGCGTTLVVKPTDDLESYKDKITNFDKDEILALKATGTHTFEKVLDDDGKETSEDKWIIDKEATCSVEGSRHKTCTKCGAYEIETIAKDTVNGHKYYSAKVDKDSTCTEEGYKSRTCRYCGHIDEKCEVIAKKNHTEGEYKITKEPTCTESGLKVMTCANCGKHMGDEITVDALGHSYKLIETVEPTTEKPGYYKYECQNCDDTYTKEYAGKLSEYTVTFKASKEDSKPQKITKTQGETITSLDYTVPEKEADKTYTYSFSHWIDESGNTVKLPIEVSKDMTLTAVYAEKYINYTVTYYYEDGVTQYKKVGYLHYGETFKLLTTGPKKSETNAETFTFKAWEANDADKTLYTDSITITGNITLRATYESTAKTYKVIYQADNFDETFKDVKAGKQAPVNTVTPKKDPDSKYHYNFKAWDRAASLQAVYSNIYTTPLYTSELHQYKTVEKTAATCTQAQIVTCTCEKCGYSFDKEGNSANGHNWSEPVYNATTGKYEKKCSHCEATTDDIAKFSVSFWASEDAEKAVKTINYIVWGTTLDASKVPAGPSKEQTSEFKYTFIGWAVKGDETKTIVDPTAQVIKADMDYVAVYKAERRTYTVVFAYDAENPIKIVKDVPAGTDVVYSGATPTKAYDSTYHYKFSGWSASTSNVQSNITVNAQFEKIKHTYTTSITPATCEVGEGTTFTCSCGYSYTKETSKALGHEWNLVDSKLPTNEEEGYNDYECNRVGCDATKHEVVAKKSWIYITVNVRDSDHQPVEGALVEVYDGKTFITSGKTDSNGQVILAVPEAKKYTIIISGGGIDKTVDTEIDVKQDGSYDEGSIPAVSVTKCSCACHRTGLWGQIFRFFHKIIKALTGEFKCCNNPDPMYNS